MITADIPPADTAAFLQRCAKTPGRCFYPCNAKHRQPVLCSFLLRQAVDKRGERTVRVDVEECEYSSGGTGWRVWPCALLLACWLASHHEQLQLQEAAVLELGCGLGLPGLASAALGARSVVLSDCLPRLLHTVDRSVKRCLAAALHDLDSDAAGVGAGADGAGCPRVRVAMLDWDEEASKVAVDEAETFSTEQGVKVAQLAAVQLDIAMLQQGCVFDLLLASDVIYSSTHARRLPAVVEARMAPDGRLLAMVPVRSAANSREFLDGLLARDLRVYTALVSPAWISGVVALQQGDCPPEGDALRAACEYDSGFVLEEGRILFVEAVRRRE